MKTPAISINRISLILVFGLLMFTTYAQDKQPSKANSDNLPTMISQPSPQDMQQQGHHHQLMPAEGPDMEGSGFHRPILDLPGLTDDQKTAIKKVDLAFMPQVTPLKKLIDADKARLEALLTMHPADVTQTDNVADEIGKTVSKLLKIMVQYDQSLRVTLSPDQQILFDARPKPWLHLRP